MRNVLSRVYDSFEMRQAFPFHSCSKMEKLFSTPTYKVIRQPYNTNLVGDWISVVMAANIRFSNRSQLQSWEEAF